MSRAEDVWSGGVKGIVLTTSGRDFREQDNVFQPIYETNQEVFDFMGKVETRLPGDQTSIPIAYSCARDDLVPLDNLKIQGPVRSGRALSSPDEPHDSCRRLTMRSMSLSLIFFIFMIFPLEGFAMQSVIRPFLTFETAVSVPSSEYFRLNNLDEHERRARESSQGDRGSDYLVARASEEFKDDPGGIIFKYKNDNCGLTFPAGRQFRVSQNGGFVEEIEGLFPLEPLSFDSMQSELKRLIRLIDGNGWERSTGRWTPNQQVRSTINIEDFANKAGPKWASVGFWKQCDNPHIKLYLEVRQYNSSLAGAFTPPAAMSASLHPLAEDRFLFLVSIRAETGSPLENEMNELRQKRRMAVNGNSDKPLSASVWLDHPDWRPPNWNGAFIK